MYNVWIVEHPSLKAITLSATYSSAEEALASASRLLKGLGAPTLTASNLFEPWGGTPLPSLVVYDPSSSVPFAALIEGACLCDQGLPMLPDEHLGPVAMHQPGPEIN